ncbi:M56 family metallopeptidase [Nonomuraea sp. SMC257]|uniref:M56 family metallopeptidase n=1 Tax=Nonomuraea montanisoli TaxID=2741721 RepID=A0A7Y6M4E4_9ACTN|nr:M56 family metallopeptidase [Nonomuraea montanisoli]NUW34713.1 M56 family metallopeptidase [Nonomuraea montanisoli]
MTAAILLAVYVVVLAGMGPGVLRRVSWVERAPRLGIMAWRSLTAAVVGAVMAAGVAVVLPASPWGADLAHGLHACPVMLRDAYAIPPGMPAVIASVAAALLACAAVMARLIHGVGAELVRDRRERRRHLAVLRMVAHRDERLGVLVIDHDAAIAYCLPGRAGPIVLSTSALAALDDRRLAAVLAHERAHLRSHHHQFTAVARGLRRAFPFVALFATAEQEIDRLTELAADDAAVRVSDRLTVADALLTLALDHSTPTPAVAAAGRRTGQRVRRLLARTPPLRAIASLTIGVLARAAIAAPLAVAALPALLVIILD